MKTTTVILSFAILSMLFFSCGKDDSPPVVTSAETKTYSSESTIKWLNMQLNMLRVPLPAGTGAPAAERAHAYSGIALYESVVPGMPAYQSLTGQLTAFPAMPAIEQGKKYHWAASANAALAAITRNLFSATATANLASVDSLENALKASYALEVDSATLNRSISFGKEVAARIAAWAATDGSANVNPPYVPPVGPGLWVSTPPNFPAAVNPYISQRRLLVPNVSDGTAPAPPPAYSTDPASAFYAMAKDVYDKSQALTPAQINMALYTRDAPGYPAGGAYIAVLPQVLTKARPALDVAALAYVKSGLALHEATVVCFVQKYTFNQVRPITYIRNVMGYTNWLAQFNTPGHPEFPAAHAVNGAAFTWMLTDVFGANFPFTLTTYDYIGLPSRSYNSFSEFGKDMADARVFAGVHFQASCDKGRTMGEKVSQNILSKLRFLK